ncbi:MAG: N-acetylmuramoyl-L-alanine amidase [Bacteroidota bacterium]
MKYLSAGHCNVAGSNYDPGAVYNNRKEADETVRVRDRVIQLIKERGYSDIIQDLNTENRNQYFNRIKTGDGSTVVEFHFNAGGPTATGTEVLIEVDADRLDRAFAKELVDATAMGLGIRNRGVKSEADTPHKRLGLMKETGIVALIEVCFISNKDDMAAYDLAFETLCRYYADIIIKFDAIIK